MDYTPEGRACSSERIMQCWINDPTTGWIEDNFKMANIFLKTNILSFHHSIIPFPGRFRKSPKPLIFSVDLRNSEISGYPDTNGGKSS
jgi:hypothetical protein